MEHGCRSFGSYDVGKQCMNIAIIGAGLAGLTLAQQLKDIAKITVFEKARGASGRLSTRTVNTDTADFQFDHGAQYFTVRHPSFQTFLKPYIETGLIQAWTPTVLTLEQGKKAYKRDWFEPHYVAQPTMTALAKRLAQRVDVQLSTQISAIIPVNQQWQLLDQHQQSHGLFDWVLFAVPAPQAYALLPESFAHKKSLLDVQFSPCFSVMLGFAQALKLNFAAAVVKHSPISWISVNSHKPQRPSAFTLLLHTEAQWSQVHVNADLPTVQAQVIQELEQLLAMSINSAHVSIHRWLYARTAVPLGQDFLIDTDQRIGVCGDWCISGRVESAFLSAMALADAVTKV